MYWNRVGDRFDFKAELDSLAWYAHDCVAVVMSWIGYGVRDGVRSVTC